MRYEFKTEKNIVIGKNVKFANNMFSRMKGLMFSSEMDGFDALLITPCNSIHTFFMNYPIDIIFLNKEYKVIKIIKNIKPWRLTGIYFKATQVLEFMGGTLNESLQEGETLEVTCIN